MRKLWKIGAAFLASVMLCTAMSGAAYAKESDYDYSMDYYGDLWWDGFTAHFEAIEGARKYDVNIARNGHHLYTATTTKKYVNFKDQFTFNGDYTFRVRGIRGSNTGEWSDFSEIQGWYEGALDTPHDDTHPSGNSGANSGTATGSWQKNGDRWWFRFADGTWPAGKWWKVDGKWYMFGSDGYMLTGWQQWNGNYYYFGTDGAMLSNTWTPDGYYVGNDGAWQR